MQNSYKIIRGTFLSPLVLGFFSVSSSFSHAEACEEIFSRLSAENAALRRIHGERNIRPNFFDFSREVDLVREWNARPDVPPLLTALFPKDVYFINHQQYKPDSHVVVKSDEMGYALIARAHWKYKDYSFDSNVVFSTRALTDNLLVSQKQNWLVSERAPAAILYFHGGGTPTTGAHTAHTILSHFKKYGIDVVAVDLPWHGEGHRHLLNNFEMEIEALGAFAQKFIPHNVPLFVAGHSWGGEFAEKIMRMSDRPNFHFHPNLKGAMILSTGLTDLSGINKSLKEKDLAKADKTEPSDSLYLPEKMEEYMRIKQKVLAERRKDFPVDEANIWSDMIRDGKINFLGGLYTRVTFQMRQNTPDHKGEKYIPTLMIVGKNDPLVYLGFEKWYEIYKALTNVKALYLDPLPSLFDKQKDYLTGHLLANRISKVNGASIHFAEMRQFIAETLNLDWLHLKPKENTPSTGPKSQQIKLADKNRDRDRRKKEIEDRGLADSTPHIVYIVQKYANNLAFREWIQHYQNNHISNTSHFIALREYTYGKGKKKDSNSLENTHKPLNEKIEGALMPYTPIVRITQLLDRISERTYESAPVTITDIKSESAFLVRPEIQSIIPNKQLVKELIKLDKQIQAISSLDQLQNLAETAQSIKTAQKLIDPRKQNRRNRDKLAFNILNMQDRESAQKKLRLLRIPPEEEKKISNLLDEFYANKRVLEDLYIPTMEELSSVGIKPGKEKTVEIILEELARAVQNKVNFEQGYSELAKEKGALSRQYEQMLQTVTTSISTIKKAVERISESLPPSLREVIQQREMELENLISSNDILDKMKDVLSKLVFEHQKPMVGRDIIPMLEENKTEVEKFRNLFNQYIQNSERFYKQAIIAMEKGEMGEKAQQAVILLYGLGSQGQHPQVGSNSLYLKFTALINKLAELETAIRQTKDSIAIEQANYNTLLNHLIRGLKSPLPALQNASMLFVANRDSVWRDIFKKTPAVDLDQINTDPRERNIAMHILESSVNRELFQRLTKEWNSLRSALPPPLPTEIPNL